MQHAKGHLAAIGLGSNVGDREANLTRALVMLASLPHSRLTARSSICETDPVGCTSDSAHAGASMSAASLGGRYLNAAAIVITTLPARELLNRLLQIERSLGRERDPAHRCAPRTLDLDLLLYGKEIIDSPSLSVPHPRLFERRFVLEPLAQIAPKLIVPGRDKSVADLLSELKPAPAAPEKR